MDAGIIRSFKANYKIQKLRYINTFLTDTTDKTFDPFKSITLKDAVVFIKNAWDEVKPEVIYNYWLHIKFVCV
jgi:hypothetical protein